MVLDAHDLLGRDFKTFEGVVVEVAVRDDDVIRQGSFVDDIAVVLRRNVDAARADVLDRMVSTAMAKGQFAALAAQGQAEHLET